MKKAIALSLAVLTLVIELVGCSKGCKEVLVSDRTLDVGRAFVNIPIAQPLKYTRKVQEIQAELAETYQITTQPSLGMRVNQQGASFMPVIEVVDSESQVYSVTASSFWGQRVVFDAPYTSGSPIVRMQMRSPEPIRLRRVVWFSYDPGSFER